MIKFKETYTINDGLGTIIFTKGRQNTVNGNYEIKGKKDSGIINGTFDGDILKGTYHNKVSNSTGLIEFTFNENGFNARWKRGLEPGPMRGNWKGLIDLDNEQTSTIKDVDNKAEIYPTQFDELENRWQVFFLQIDCPESLSEFHEITQSTALFFKEKINENAIGFMFEEVTDPESIACKTNNFSLLTDNFSEKLETVFNSNKKIFEDGDGAFFMAFLIPVDRYMSPIINSLYGTLEDLWENLFRELSTIIKKQIQIFSYHEEFSDIIKQKYYKGDFFYGMINSKLEDFSEEDDCESDHLKSEAPPETFPIDEIFELSTYIK